MKRRSFIKLSALSAGIAGLGLGNSCMTSLSDDTKNNLYLSFKDPGIEAKPFARWWWNGNVVNRDEIERELKIMKDGGIGGVEITPIGMPDEVQNIQGEPIVWLSDEWLQILKFATDKAGELGMKVDMIVGTGWPFGGDFLEEHETIQGIQQRVVRLEGPSKQHIDQLLPETDHKSEIIQLKLISENITSITNKKDLLSSVKNNGIDVEVPDGTHYLHIVSWRQNYDQVYLGAPGGDGPVLDHFNVVAVRKYLTRTSDKLKEVFGDDIGGYIRSMFCDSIELHGANWTSDFEEEFQKRKGYEINPYLPLILDEAPVYNNVVDTIEQARFDFYDTLSQLFMERFLKVFHEWCNEIGVKSRYQAYGFPLLYTHMTDGSMVPDIPEGDQFLYNSAWQQYANINDIRYAVWNKYASSGGKLAKRKIVSTEAMSNLKGVFKTTLGYIKQATDLDICAGINHFILHGYNYSPPEAGFPGWIRFGTYFSDQNTWWPYFKEWSEYTSRISAVLQKTNPVSHIALFSPIEDTWSKYGLDRNAYNYNPWYLHAIWQGFNHNGCITDYLSPSTIINSEAKNQKLSYNGVDFSTLVVCSPEYMHVDVAGKLEKLASEGVNIIFIGGLPTKSVGDSIKDSRLKFNNPEVFKQQEAPGEEVKKSQQAMANWIKKLISAHNIKPLIQVEKADPSFFFNYSTHDNKKVFLLFNSSENDDLKLNLQLPISQNEVLEYWISENGERKSYPHESGKININLLPTGSLLLVTSEDSASNLKKYNTIKGEEQPLKVNNPWNVTLEHFNGDKSTLKLSQLKDLSKIDEYDTFSGTIIYEANFDLDDAKWKYLNLGKTTDAAEIFINDKKAGIRWHEGQLIEVSELLKNGNNSIKLIVKTTLFNYARTLNNNPTAMKWVKNARSNDLVPTGLLSPLTLVH